MPIAELFLGALLPVLFQRLASPELLDFARREGIDNLLKKWEKMLNSINQVLDDAEERQLTSTPGVESWLKDLGNLAYDIEDLLDEFATKSAENNCKAQLGNSKVRSLLPSCCFKLSPRAFMFDRKMRSTIKEMDNKLQDIITRKDTFNFGENNGNRSAYRRQDKPLPTTYLPEPGFVSRKDEISEILELLTKDEDDRTCANLKVIPIVGMGGVGKTALTQQVYNDARVTDYFDVKAWACVSEDYNVLAITKSILGITNGHLSCEGKDFNWLQDKLKEHLAGKKFLVVLDDVWNENYGNWTTLLKPFQSGAKESRIILTTRNKSVASLASAPPYYLKELSQDACMTLLAFHAFGVGNFDHHPDLKVLGHKIAEKCKGLPLAVKTLAGLLRHKVNPQEWKAILNSKIWDLRNEILPALKLSYLHLPSNLRRCFAYCAIFPKDYEIEQDNLIHWWIAEGLLEVKEAKNLWNTGLNYFNELVSRSLFQKSSINGSQFLMHDLVNDLAKLVAGATYFSPEEFEFEGNQSNASFARHASFIPSDRIVPKRLEIYHRMKGLRSFISLRKPYGWFCLSQKVLCDLLSIVKYLRVLSLSHYRIREVPDCLGKLRHLRHLNLSYTNIEMLPKSIVALYNLEALMLRACEYLTELPKGMEKLINLKFLDVTDTPNLRAMPMYIGNLVGLEMLSKFVVGTKNGLRLKELKNLKDLKGELCISNLHKVQEVGDAKEIDLITKEGICRLTMQWSPDFEISRNEDLEAEILDFLHPHQNLENLVISYYGGLKFPSWLESPPHLNIVHLRLHGCCKAKTLPSLGQLSSLKEMYIEGLNAICTIGSEFYGNDDSSFPSLITLEFKDMPLWEDWSHCVGIEEVGVLFPRLEHLLIQDCPVLIGKLPSQLGSLTKLEIKSCPHMDASPSVISLPSLKELKFISCNERVLKSLVNLTSLTSLVIEDVFELTCLNHEFTSSPVKLEELYIKRCEKLTYLWQDRDVIQNLVCLKRLVVDRCPEFMYLVVEEGDIDLPSNLEAIYLSDCIKLEKLPSKMHSLNSLKHLLVENCPNLVSFPETGIPTSMISLQIEGYDRLQHLPRGLNVDPDELGSINTRGDKMSCLQSLVISSCNSLPTTLFSGGMFLPITLKSLEICFCQNVESLAQINLAYLQSIQKIKIVSCYKLRSLPKGLNTLFGLKSLSVYHLTALELECFPPLPLGISTFELYGCPKIKSLPNQLHRLTSLRHLDINGCESITRFPKGGLPPQLESLWVLECENMKQPVREWLTPLTSLRRMIIDGSVGGVGEEEDLVLPLPSSLLDLYINDMGKVERLSSSLPPSLQFLNLWNCPKLRELPQDGFPPSLELLRIMNCPILEERCKKGTGYYWPLIREIPQVSLTDDPNKSIT
ncbi:putative disease resistance RPP13-like protein 1 isoform X1 [Eucalyptus grandis]|uniref:putative disease resistance RPP13-like protein 1 isoform X1 n=1 Tax=Eucalyptus grandis TaxID=71139 RepID=UPI00192EE437|nr:putative disease resistance RPP13-like protein 1 isoform X1 [Eucalyptus grandis]XP_039163417.1 putative disease resistance RPP13-like protein 1 isoform X1 [Eucalyptus grandis]XP_039163418.1 putative disease resistance RPP13-like protein 1 isoform X1 [Eucalyptus grandis]XP_039163419.1 putative disease resistance RPP13-like protein 1 isoform X1 [Eucalyptus grandis]XP_039163420.1 putative disease resistance RPP13-like protein 1 isoform X1 [Eucalyptus grandis]XP_039163421.1 putative disease res